MPYGEDNLPALLRRLIQTAGASPSAASTTQSNLAGGEAAVRDDGATFFDAITMAEAVQLYSAVRDLKPAASAEIGFCCGGSGMAILQALADDGGDGTHYACDPYQTSYARRAGLANVEAAGLQARLRFHEAFPEAAVPGFPRIQFAFIDASHLFDLSVLDFVLIDKRLDVGGVIGFHDLWMPSLQKVVRHILANRGYEVYHVPGDAPARPPSSRLRGAAASVARRLPRSAKIFAPEFLHPWAEVGIGGNIALLRKTTEDARDWRHFVPF